MVYAVTSSGCDFYSAMTRVSAASIRITNPNIGIVLACDDHSVAAMRHSRDPLLDEVDELITCRTPAGNSSFRNRFVKTQLRLLLDGPFLFLDSDTIVRGNMMEIFLLDTDIACAPNFSRDGIEQQTWKWDSVILSTMGWSHNKEVYVNGGVLFYNATRGAALFAADWHRKWLSSHAVTKHHVDQPALNAAIFDTAPRLEILPHRFNAQFDESPSIVPHAIIWHYYVARVTKHYYADRVAKPPTELERLVVDLQKGAKLRRSHVESILQKDHPWKCDSWIDDFVARRVIKRGFLVQADRLWFQGHGIKSVRRRILTLILMRLIGRTGYQRVKRWWQRRLERSDVRLAKGRNASLH